MIRYIILAALLGTIGTVQSTRNKMKSKPYDIDCGYNTKYYQLSQGSQNDTKFPWTVAILKKVDKTEIYKCDGSLIHSQVVLTVANCAKFLTGNKVFIRAGASDPLSGDLNRYQDKIVKYIIIHENYNPSTQENNFALLYLDEPIDINVENVGIVCLPKSTDVFNNKKCKISFLDKDTYDVSNDSGNLENPNKKVAKDPLIESDLSRNSKHQYENVIGDSLIESDLSGILKSPSKKVAKDPLIESDLSGNPKHQYENVIGDLLIESDLSGILKRPSTKMAKDPLIESDLSGNSKHRYENVIEDSLIESDLSGILKSPSKKVVKDSLIESDLPKNSKHQYKNVGRDSLIESDLSGNSKRRYKKFILKIKNADITIKESKYCQSNNPSTKQNKSFICGFSQARQVCEAAEGSPIVCPHPNDVNRWVHVGSFIFRCQNPTNKQIKNKYVNIADACNWIDEKLNILIAQ